MRALVDDGKEISSAHALINVIWETNKSFFDTNTSRQKNYFFLINKLDTLKNLKIAHLKFELFFCVCYKNCTYDPEVDNWIFFIQLKKEN